MRHQPLVHRIQRIAGVLAIALAPSVCAAAVFQRISPDPHTYVQGSQADFIAFPWSGSGDVTAGLTAAGGVVIPPTPVPTSQSGCHASDFIGFPAGNIALIQRGTCMFSEKVANAEAAGASGVIIFNEGQPGRTEVIQGTLSGPGAAHPVLDTSFAVGSDLYSRTLSGPVTVHIVVGPIAQALSPAKLWLGLKNSDSVGLRVDLAVRVSTDGAGSGQSLFVGQGVLENQSTGSSGFNAAQLKTIDLFPSGAEVAPGDHLLVQVYARRTCSGPGHNSGTVRLWYNGQPIDSGATRDAGSRFGITIGSTTSDYFLRQGFALETAAGSSRLFADASVNSSVPCHQDSEDDRPLTLIGTWTQP